MIWQDHYLITASKIIKESEEPQCYKWSLNHSNVFVLQSTSLFHPKTAKGLHGCQPALQHWSNKCQKEQKGRADKCQGVLLKHTMLMLVISSWNYVVGRDADKHRRWKAAIGQDERS